MLPNDQLQKYVVRAVTGFGDRDRVQEKDISVRDLAEAEEKVVTLAGEENKG